MPAAALRIALPVAALLALVAAPAWSAPPAALAEPGAAGLDPARVDEAWAAAALAELERRYPHVLDVGFAAGPPLHVGVLFHGPVPADLGAVHPALPTRGYDVSAAVPLTHDPIVPLMKIAAQQVPPGIRPGAWMDSPSACTMAHVARDTLGQRYILTAGHCVDRVGQRVALDPEGDIGSVVAFRNAGVGRDYALVRIDAQHHGKIDPSMVGWHGPQGLATEPELGLVKHYGWGALTWQAHATRCRAGVTLPEWWGVTSFAFEGEVIWGDSGSGANTGSGKALGIITHLGGIEGNSVGTRATYALQQLGAAIGRTLAIEDGGPIRDACDVVQG